MEKPIDRIKAKLDELGLKKTTVSEQAGYSPAFLRKIEENPDRAMTGESAERLAEILNVNPSWILWGNKFSHEPTHNERLHIDPDILYDVILRLNQELVKQKKKMNASERSFAIALGYEEKHRKINGLPPLRPEEIAMLIKRPDREDVPQASDDMFS